MASRNSSQRLSVTASIFFLPHRAGLVRRCKMSRKISGFAGPSMFSITGFHLGARAFSSKAAHLCRRLTTLSGDSRKTSISRYSARTSSKRPRSKICPGVVARRVARVAAGLGNDGSCGRTQGLDSAAPRHCLRLACHLARWAGVSVRRLVRPSK